MTIERGTAALPLAAMCAAALAFAAGAALAQEAKRVGGSGAWSAYQAGNGKKRVCFVHGAPKESRGKYKRRGKTYLQVTHRPGEKVRHVASITAGYIYKKGSRVDVTHRQAQVQPVHPRRHRLGGGRQDRPRDRQGADQGPQDDRQGDGPPATP